MGAFDKARAKAEQLIGAAKQQLGKRTGNARLEDAGTLDRTEGKAKEAGHDLKDLATVAYRDVKDKLGGKRA